MVKRLETVETSITKVPGILGGNKENQAENVPNQLKTPQHRSKMPVGSQVPLIK